MVAPGQAERRLSLSKPQSKPIRLAGTGERTREFAFPAAGAGPKPLTAAAAVAEAVHAQESNRSSGSSRRDSFSGRPSARTGWLWSRATPGRSKIFGDALSLEVLR
jgi:hypothetical protein